MKLQASRFFIWLTFISLIAAVFFLPLIGPIIHESDQASLLDGALRIARDGDWYHQAFYNYDKQYASYWQLAFFDKIFSISDPDALVLTGNLVNTILIFISLCLVGFRIQSWTQFILLLTVALSPSLLTHGPYLASNYFSAFWLCMEFFALGGKGKLRAWTPLFALFAVASRADAVLVQPLLFWVFCPEFRISAILKSILLWVTAVFCCFGLVLGKIVAAPGFQSFEAFSPFFNLRLFAGFTVFGLGATAFLLFLEVVSVTRMLKEKSARLFFVSGLIFLLIPFVFYGLQIYSTRHWTTIILAVAFYAASPNGMSFLSELLENIPFRKSLYAILLGMAIVPLFIGISMPILSKFKFTLTHPTLFPSADGMLPMGAYIGRAWGWDRANRYIPDYNQAIWIASKNTLFVEDLRGFVPILNSPLYTIIRFAATTRRENSIEITQQDFKEYPYVYTDDRYLRKGKIEVHKGEHTSFDSIPYEIFQVSPLVKNDGILMLIYGRTNSAWEIMTILQQRFSGDDFERLENLSSQEVLDFIRQGLGRHVVILSEKPFELTTADGKNLSSSAERNAWNAFEATFNQPPNFKFLHGETSQKYILAISRLPVYMSVGSYRNATY